MACTTLAQKVLAMLDELDRRSARGAHPREDHRIVPRYSYRKHARLHLRHDATMANCWIHTRDLSACGLGCVHLDQLAPGTAVMVSLKAAAGTSQMAAHVVHCQPLRKEMYLLGLCFEGHIDPNDLLSHV
jgi:hypothetical protein